MLAPAWSALLLGPCQQSLPCPQCQLRLFVRRDGRSRQTHIGHSYQTCIGWIRCQICGRICQWILISWSHRTRWDDWLLVRHGAMNHTPPASHAVALIQAFKATPELASITMDEICHQVVGDNLPLVNMNAHSSKTNLLCSLKPLGTTVLTKLPGAAESLSTSARRKLPQSPP